MGEKIDCDEWRLEPALSDDEDHESAEAGGEPQDSGERVGALSLIPATTAPTPALEVTMLSASKRTLASDRVSTRQAAARPAAASASGAEETRTDRHPQSSVSTPPSTGPKELPRPKTAIHSPFATARRRPVNSAPIVETTLAMTNAPLMPMRVRSPMRATGHGLSAARTAAAA